MQQIKPAGRLAVSLPLSLALAAPAIAEKTPSFPRIAVEGLGEIEAYHATPYTGADESDIVLATGALGVEAILNEWLSAEVTTLYEENATPLEIDTASVSVIHPDQVWSLRAGQFYVPFGLFETAMVSDPLTLELGEARETAISAQAGAGGFRVGVYTFNGDADGETRVDNWGATVDYEADLGEVDVLVAGGYLNHLGESDALQEQVAASDEGRGEEVGAWTATTVLDFHGFTLVGEYLAAIDDFAAGQLAFHGVGARPAAWNVEVGYGFHIHGRPAQVALGYQGSEEAVEVGLPRRRALAAFSVDVWRNTTLGFEYAHDHDYDPAEGGTGETAGTFTTQLALSF
ncbi:LbtU family siderophore porin [Guyparkeria hydrothermalis]|uniref:LbtU family siderophore porin n=1 Tax=Guyparkeria hydrothermalis TaxID=923 RepID=UPI0020222F31|nr:LbtU family siderophore porin [Guyparkeria hydrothermalis]MCL7744415.1 LbtU family siderophore porin [Guyparkeria hydrothermalis]